MAYFSGQGRVYIGARDDSGNPLGLDFVGNVPDLKVSLSVETLEHKESTSGQRLTDLQLIKSKKGEFSCTLEELRPVNLELALYGTTKKITSGSVTSEALPNPIEKDKLYLLEYQNVSSVVINDSTPTPPQTLQASEYTVNEKYGSVIIHDISSSSYVEPLLVNYSYGDYQSTVMFTKPLPERWIRFEGLNTVDSNREVIIDFYRVAMNPANEFSVITEELLKFDITGQALADTLKPVDGMFGQFGHIILL